MGGVTGNKPAELDVSPNPALQRTAQKLRFCVPSLRSAAAELRPLGSLENTLPLDEAARHRLDGFSWVG